jgi:hypothetical protein
MEIRRHKLFPEIPAVESCNYFPRFVTLYHSHAERIPTLQSCSIQTSYKKGFITSLHRFQYGNIHKAKGWNE